MDFTKSLTTEFTEGAIKFFTVASSAAVYVIFAFVVSALALAFIAFAQLRQAAAAERRNAIEAERLRLESARDARRPAG